MRREMPSTTPGKRTARRRFFRSSVRSVPTSSFSSSFRSGGGSFASSSCRSSKPRVRQPRGRSLPRRSATSSSRPASPAAPRRPPRSQKPFSMRSWCMAIPMSSRSARPFLSQIAWPASSATPATSPRPRRPARAMMAPARSSSPPGVARLARTSSARRWRRALRPSLRDATWRFLTGPNLPEVDYALLAAAAGPGTIVERFRPDFSARLANAALSISQAGYNTVMDILRVRVPRGRRPLRNAVRDRAAPARRSPRRPRAPGRRTGRVPHAGHARRRDRRVPPPRQAVCVEREPGWCGPNGHADPRTARSACGLCPFLEPER